ncbi:hypothetical protein X770_00830 [Mesorhizobium sp. LSJC269B00]|uniref:hypothetical protein n=1 Tax=Mesorhizobium sp. LSJC269B00 TaxID=1287326 RepID=UPI0003CF5BDE|nr:hypothetical protein [Mesorhizobium sp. LSJC269B00]ESW93806.1 hypothetical protein X770_00830 [Mesorhizobium sp. LSJC269B00]
MERALYYPYMRIEDEGWLKATLLLFDQVQRIVPERNIAGDTEAIKRYTRATSKNGPLLEAAPLWENHVRQAQCRLALRIEADAKSRKFLDRFSEDTTLRERPAHDRFGFQMHHRKLDQSLRQVLAKHRLAWKPGQLEIYDENAEYVALHPILGEAIMSTIAVACALTEGAHIVGDKRSGTLHEQLLSLQVDDVYDGVIRGRPTAPVKRATDHELFEVVVALSCDLSKIGPKELAALGEDREAIRELLGALATSAQSIGPMYPGKKRDVALQDHVAPILSKWRNDAANVPNYTRRLLGLNLLDPSKDTMAALIQATSSLTAGGATAFLATPLGPAVQLGLGVAVSFITHGIKTYVEMRSGADKSLYRYLTAMEKAGVVFRSETAALAARESE